MGYLPLSTKHGVAGNRDFLIIGGGLAGACLALEFRRRGKSVWLIDLPGEHSASRVAAGLYNPVTGKLAGLTWKAAAIFPFLEQFYAVAEQTLEQKFLFPLPIYRPFRTNQEFDSWNSRRSEPSISPFVKNAFSSATYPEDVKDHLGGLLLKYGGHVDTRALLNGVSDWLSLDGSFLAMDFNPSRLSIGGHGVQYEGRSASTAIFCQGIGALENPWTSWLPLRPLKGQVLKIDTRLSDERIYNRGVFLVRDKKDGFWKVGATHEHHAQPGVTVEGREELEGKLRTLLQRPFETREQSWGIRPTVPDRRPLVGVHPENSRVWILNGLGTKGVSLAPWMASHLVDHLLTGTVLPEDVNISRFYSLYFKSQKTV